MVETITLVFIKEFIMGISETQVLTALVVALFPAVMAAMLGSALANE